MVINIELRYAREPELVAIKLSPSYNFHGLARQALRAFITNTPFEIHMPGKGMYENGSLKCALRLDEKRDAEIIEFLKKLKAPKTTFIRNLMLKYITGDTSYAYLDEELKKMAISDKCKELCATVAQSESVSPEQSEEKADENYQERMIKALENLKSHVM